MRRSVNVVTAFIFFALAGCSSDATAPSNALIGQWGGSRVELVSSASAVTVRFPCGQLSGSGALVPDEGGSFTHTVRSTDPSSAETLSLEGVVNGDVVTFDLIANTSNGSASITFVATRNVAPDFSGVVCAAADNAAR